MGGRLGGLLHPPTPRTPVTAVTSSSGLSVVRDMAPCSATQLSPAAWIESIGQWIMEAVPVGGNISLDPFLFSIGRAGHHTG